MENLEPGAEYGARVCPVRVTTTSGELCGPYSPCTTFTTVPLEASNINKVSSSSSNQSTPTHQQQQQQHHNHHHHHTHKNRHHYLISMLNDQLRNLRNLNDQQYVFLFPIIILLLGIVIAIGCSFFFSKKEMFI